jgi:hypothetical protein
MKPIYEYSNWRQTLRKASVQNLNFEVTSDNHCNNTKKDIDILIEKIISSKKTNILFILWDIINNNNWEDVTQNINYILNKLANFYETIIYTPGNHELRGKKNPFSWYKLQSNILMPIETENVKIEIKWVKILAMNLLYDKDFFQHEIKQILWLNNKLIEEFYMKIPDWNLLNIDFEKMNRYKENAINSIDNTDIILTHWMTYPHWLDIKTISKQWESIEELIITLKSKKIRIDSYHIEKIIKKENEIRKKLKKYWIKTTQFNNFDIYNYKRLWLDFSQYIRWTRINMSILWSNIFENWKYKDWLISIHWHNHSYLNQNTMNINSKKVHFLSNTLN